LRCRDESAVAVSEIDGERIVLLVHDGERRAVAAVKGPDAIATGKLPTASGELGNCVKVPSPLPFKIVTLLVA